ncbi:hypothetical protein B9Z55_020751 [Caenorhabditis nigoni]|uniref:Uncharacterized protein n=1 Tax=Caenorhabditis nigoni TaxID=1611254 RepID=A0A2G5TPU4_9PELO|nr:hypothetical protein B9Z55_020751 [Caenorhabditis nigoni]
MANHEEFMVFTRPKLDYLTAMGNNAFGKLGVGSDALIIEEPTRVQIGGHVENVFIGSRHTIFWMANGDIYGCGWTANFLFGPQTKESISIPIKLNYITAEKPDFIRIVVTDNSTEFFDYLPYRKLVVGQLKAGDVAVTTGPNWSIVNEKFYRYQRKAPVDLKIPDSNGAEKNIKINIGLTPRFKPFLAEGDSRPWRYAVVFADGYRVDTTITPCEYTVCRNGTVYAMISGTFYKGCLKFGPGGATEKCVDVLVVVLEEFILPQTVERFAVDSDGNSFIFYPFKSGTILNTFWPGGQVFEVMKKTRHEPMEAQKLVMNFQKIFDELENEFPTWKSTIYDSTGLPTKASKVLCGLLTLQHFIRVKDGTNTQDVLGRGLVGIGPEDTNKFMERLDYEMDQSILQSTKFPVFTVKPGSGHRIRKQMIEEQSVEYMTQVMSKIRELIINLTEFPVDMDKADLYRKFFERVHDIIMFTNKSLVVIRKDSTMCSLHFPLAHRQFQPAGSMKDVLEGVDVSDTRFQKVRVEGVGVNRLSEKEVYYMDTTETFIRFVDRLLLGEIDDNGVLNLNRVCMDSPYRFRSADPEKYFRSIHFDTVCEQIREKDLYKIVTHDGAVVRAPKVFFELFSEYDQGRISYEALNQAQPINVLNVNFSESTVRAMLDALVDPRTFFNLPFETKLDVFQSVDYFGFKNLRQDLLKMIVLPAIKEEVVGIQNVLKLYSNELAPLIAELRPDIILFWKDFEFPEKVYWQIMKKVSDTMKDCLYQSSTELLLHEKKPNGSDCYSRGRIGKRSPPYSMPDTKVEEGKINEQWLSRLLYDEVEDQDLEADLKKSLFAWNHSFFAGLQVWTQNENKIWYQIQ